MLHFLAYGVCKGSVIALVALGFGLIYATTRVFHIAHAAAYVAGAYALYAGILWFRLPIAAAALLGLAASIAVGLLLDWSVYRPLARRSSSAAAILISSIGAQIIAENLISMTFGTQSQVIRSGFETTVSFGSVILTRAQIAEVALGGGLTAGLWLFLRGSRAGRVCRAVADDETLARVLGVKVGRVRVLAFSVGSAFAGVGAMIVALDVGMDPYIGFPAVLGAAVACMIGGFGSLLAPALGGLALGVVQSLVVWQSSAKWEQAVTFGVLIIFVLFRRQGLWGGLRRAEEE
jgi:branched-chain amino acid transport system permease protein